MTEEQREIKRVMVYAPLIAITAFVASVVGLQNVLGGGALFVGLFLLVAAPMKYMSYKNKQTEDRFDRFKEQCGLQVDYAIRAFDNAVVIDRTNRKVFLGAFEGNNKGKVYGFDDIRTISKETHNKGNTASYVLCVETSDFDNPRIQMRMGAKHHSRDEAHAKIALALGMK